MELKWLVDAFFKNPLIKLVGFIDLSDIIILFFRLESPIWIILLHKDLAPFLSQTMTTLFQLTFVSVR